MKNKQMMRLLLFLVVLSCVQAYKTIIDVLSEDARFSTLITHLQHTRLIPTINNLDAGTFFAPDNDAFSKYKGDDITKEMLLYHLLPVQYQADDFNNGQVVESSYVRPGFLGSRETGQFVKITEKLKTILYINEARITDRDIFVNRNTTLHVINKVLEPPKILSKILEKHDEKLYSLMEKTNLDQLISQEKPFTTFVSSKFLLDRFKKVEQNYLTSKYGDEDLKHILKYLVIPETIIFDRHSAGESTYTTESGEKIKINIDKNGKITVDGHKVVEKDILAANGVLHILDDLPYADSIVFDARKYLYGLNATKFVSLLDEYGLGEYLDNSTKNITLLVPPNEVIDEDDIPNNQKKQWLSYHIAQGAWSPSDLYNHKLLETTYHAPQLDNQAQRLLVTLGDKSIHFGDHSKVIGSEMSINDNVIYRLSDPLQLPTDIFTSLILDFDLSTFIATLYASGAITDIQKSNSISLFVPTNDAFKNLGLVSRYLVHPSGRGDLQTILKYHAVTSTLYYEDMVNDALEVTTLANESLIINGKGDSIWIGDNEDHGTVEKSDILVSNGVVHKVDHIQLPEHINITHRNLLRGIKANTMLNILKETNLLDELSKDCIILCPTDKAFEYVDMESLYNDTEKLVRLVKLHILPKSEGRRRWFPMDKEYETLLSSRDRVIMRNVGFGSTVVRVKGESYSTMARVLDMGRVSNGDGGIMEIDSVLFPVERGVFGLPWLWSFVVLSLMTVVMLSLLTLVGFVGVKKWKRAREGYTEIQDNNET